jgi:hypothetical protein
VTVIRGRTVENRPFVAVPFYSLANRGKSSQEVWQTQDGKPDTSTGWQGALYREYRAFPTAAKD